MLKRHAINPTHARGANQVSVKYVKFQQPFWILHQLFKGYTQRDIGI